MLRRDRIEAQLGGNYLLQKRLGRGGMGDVWSARDRRLERWVALKILGEELSHDAGFRERFLREGKTLAKFQHPRIVRVLDLGTLREDERLYMVMELLRGKTLRALLDEQAGAGMTPTVAAFYAFQVLDALGAAHDAGIVHRDVKPENMIVGDGGDLTLLDFGIARGREATAPREGHARGKGARSTLLGTPRYMAPELVAHGLFDHRSDLYAVGIVLAMALTGEYPYPVRADDEAGIFDAHVRRAPALRREANPECPEVLWEIALRLLEKDPARRYQGADDAREDIYAALRRSLPGDHALAKRLHGEHAERAMRAAADEGRSPAAAKGAGAIEGRIDVTVPLSDGYVAVSPCAPEASGAEAPAVDVTKPIPAGQAPPAMRAPFPLAAPRWRPVELSRGLRRAAAEEDALYPPSPLSPPVGRKGEGSGGAPRARRFGVLAGIAVGTVGSWVTFAIVMSWKTAAPAPAAGAAATASASTTASVTAAPGVSSAPSASAAPSGSVNTVPAVKPSASAKPSAPRPAKSRLIFGD
jgi:serine/threonine-protein kinase